MARRKSKSGQGAVLGKETITVDGLQVLVTYKNIQSVRIKVKGAEGRVEVSAPPYVTYGELEKIVRNRRQWIEAAQKQLPSSPMVQAENASPEEQKAWLQVVSAFVPVLVETWEPIMGVKAKRLAYRNMKSRWGSCQPATGRICINTRLALYPPECLEYVVVHELCHLLERGHGPRFKELMDHFLPDWRERKGKLRS